MSLIYLDISQISLIACELLSKILTISNESQEIVISTCYNVHIHRHKISCLD